MTNFIISIALAFLSSVGFSIIANIPKKIVPTAGVIGCLAWVVYYVLKLKTTSSIFIPNICASFFIGLAGNYCAKKYKMPALMFYAGAIIPLVPGGLAFTAAQHFKSSDINVFMSGIVNIIKVSSSLTIGIGWANVITKKYQKPKKMTEGAKQ